MKVDIFYGMSGALKGTTIESLGIGPDSVMYSEIKTWKHYQFGLFRDKTEYNDLNFGLLHLTRLKEFMKKKLETGSDDRVIVERGITDCLFYYYYNGEFGNPKGNEDEAFIRSLVEEEKRLVTSDSTEVKKSMMIQLDRDFVRDHVFSDEIRRKTFNGDVDLYFKLQDKYVEFTKKYNNINNVIEINDAKGYITKVLGNEYLS